MDLQVGSEEADPSPPLLAQPGSHLGTVPGLHPQHWLLKAGLGPSSAPGLGVEAAYVWVYPSIIPPAPCGAGSAAPRSAVGFTSTDPAPAALRCLA